MFSNNDKVFRTTGEVEFDGTMKSYTKVCDLLGLEPVSNLWRWRPSIDKHHIVFPDKTAMIVTTTEDGDTAIMAGDNVKLDHGDISVIRKGEQHAIHIRSK